MKQSEMRRDRKAEEKQRSVQIDEQNLTFFRWVGCEELAKKQVRKFRLDHPVKLLCWNCLPTKVSQLKLSRSNTLKLVTFTDSQAKEGTCLMLRGES